MGTDIISQSFNDLLNSEPVDGGGFHVEPMNKCIEDAHLLPPLIPLYPDIVLEGDLSIIFGQSEHRQDHLCHADCPIHRRA